MSFLSPGMIALAAGLTIPPLIALYFLKLKRHVKLVPSTLLWRKAVEDLQVNAPFQRLRSNLLLLLQLLVLIAGAVALGKPMFQTAKRYEGTSIILIDQSASMGVVEADGRTRLAIAKEEARRRVDNLDDNARAMVIAFCDRANVVSSFDTDKDALKRKIDTIEQTQSTSTLSEAVSLAEAYTQNMIIGREEGPDVEIRSNEPAPQVFLFTDGRVEDTGKISVQRLDIKKMRMTTIGRRSDNVGILAMDTRRNYEHPERMEVTATLRNFGDQPVTLDAVLYVADKLLDVQTVTLAATPPDGSAEGDTEVSARESSLPAPGSVRVLAFDELEFGGGGLVEVRLRIDDALSADNRAWRIIPPPRNIRVLLVTTGNLFLENALANLTVKVERMSGADYESADDEVIREGDRSAFDVVIFDRHSTARLPQGNYLFFGSIPQIDGVSAGKTVSNEVIFNWDDTHPILRYVSVESLFVYEWLALSLPSEAVSLIDGESTPVLSYLTRKGSQYLICAFPLISEDASGQPIMNTYWVTTVDFVVFMQNAVQYLGSNVVTVGRRSVSPGEAVSLSVPTDTSEVKIHRPDGSIDKAFVNESTTVHYAHTQQVGPYVIEPGDPGADTFAVNLFNAQESWVRPKALMTLGAQPVASQAGSVKINEPAWPYLLIAMLVLLLLEWIVYNRRVFV